VGVSPSEKPGVLDSVLKERSMARNKETELQLRIMAELAHECVLFRIPAGLYWAGEYKDGIVINPRAVKVAVKGHPDLAGYRRRDGKAVFIEVKTEKGKATPAQKKFIKVAQESGAIAGVCRSVAEARQLLDDGLEEKIDKAMQAAAASKEWRKKDGSEKKGMIVIGYPGVGKSTLAAKDRKYLDLESSIFSVDGVRREDWYKEYIVLAEYFSRQGYIVFVSSHGLVQQELIGSKERVVIVYPTLMLYRSWIKKLEDRYDNDPVRKNYVSYQNVKEGILLQVKDMMKSPFERIEIKDMNYDLEQMIAARVEGSK
jgi:hypothetical protein